MDIVIKDLDKTAVCGAYRVEKSSLDTPWSEGELESLINDGNKFYFTSCFENNVVGIAGFYKIIDECMITNIAVLEEYRGNGIASKLLCHLIDTAKKQGCTFATLEVSEKNTPAIMLYKKFGFVTNGRRKGYYHGVDALLFRKELV